MGGVATEEGYLLDNQQAAAGHGSTRLPSCSIR